jgi:hypothetical protein
MMHSVDATVARLTPRLETEGLIPPQGKAVRTQEDAPYRTPLDIRPGVEVAAPPRLDRGNHTLLNDDAL